MKCKTAAWATGVLLLLTFTIGPRAAASPPGRPARQGPALAGDPVARRLAGLATTPPVPQKLGTDAATTPAATAPAPAVDPTDYSEESARLVAGEGEVVSVLKNGLTVIARRIPSPVVSVQAWVRTGSVYEGRWLGGGLSHLLEHLVAGGSCRKYPEAEARNLLQRIGNNSNAYTTQDHTVYFVDTTTDHVAEAADLVTAWVFGALIRPEEYAREYQVVQRELEKDLGEADWVYYDLTFLNRYQVSPARVPVIGYQAVIRGLSRDEVYEYYQSTYVPQNVVVSVAGDLDPEALLNAVREHVRHVPPGRVPSKAIVEEPPVLAPRTLAATFPRLGPARLQLAFPSVRSSEADLYALDLLAAVLGAGESSVLVQEVRDRKQLVSQIAAGDDTPNYVAGTFAVDMTVETGKIKEATEAVLSVLERYKTEPVPEDRLRRAKALIRSAEAMRLQTAENHAAFVAENFIATGTPDSTYTARVERVTAEQVKAVANKYLDRSRLLTTALLPREAMTPAPSPTAGPSPTPLADAQRLLRQAVPVTRPAPATGPSAVTRVELPDGTVLLVKRVAASPVVSIQLLALGGLTAEDEKSNGLGNLAMQLLARGTRARDAEQIATFFDSIGGTFSASSGPNTWGWSATCLKGDFVATMEVFADLARRPAFPEAELGPMKERVLAELSQQEADWSTAGRRFFNQVYFGPSHSPYQFSPLGTKANVQAFTADQLRGWYDRKILTAPRVLAIYGDVDERAARDLAGKLLADWPQPAGRVEPLRRGPLPAPVASPGPASLEVTKVEVKASENSESAVFIGFKDDAFVGEDDAEVLTLAATLAGGYGYPTGYIFETLRGQGLVYDAGTAHVLGRDKTHPGVFRAYAACDPEKVDAVIDGILLNIARLQGEDSDLDLDWFARAKETIVTTDAMNDETADAQGADAAVNELFGLGHGYRQTVPARVKAIAPAQVRSAARQKLRQCVVTVVTSKPALVKSKPGPRRYESFPPVELSPKGVQHDVGGGGKSGGN